MAKVRSNEILEKALPTDPGAIPRFDIKAPDGSVLASDVTLELKNKVLQSGMPVDKQAIDECLAASGAVYGDKKVLILDQENFVLFDGAPVRIKLFDALSGACTLNVNKTGAKRIKTSSGEDPDGFVKDMWVDLIYCADKDQYVIAGGSATYSLGTSINLLEEVESMKFCKVVTLENGEYDIYSEWLRLGVLSGICETQQYRWYARLCEAATQIEFLRVSKDTMEAAYFVSEAFSAAPFPAGTLNSIATNDSYEFATTGKLQLIPVRNGDCILFAALTAFYSDDYDQSASSHTYVNQAGIMVGVVFPDLTVYTDTSLVIDAANADRNGHIGNAMSTQIGILNGVLSSDGTTIFYTGFDSYSSFSSAFQRIFPGVLKALDTRTHTHIWQYFGTLNPTYTQGRAVWVVNETKAVWFAASSSSNSYYSAGTMSFSAASAPTQEDGCGEKRSYYGITDKVYGAPFCLGWYLAADGNSVGLLGFDSRDFSGAAVTGIGYAKMLLVSLLDNSLQRVLRKTSIESATDTSRASWFCLPGYVSRPYVFFIGSQVCNIRTYPNNLSIEALLRRETVATGISVDGAYNSVHIPFFTDCFAIWQESNKLALFDGASAVADFIRKSGCFEGETGLVLFTDGSVASIHLDGIVWHCDEDGIYKFIMVGGGAPGSQKKAGNAGSLSVASCFVAAGTDVLLRVGRGGAMLPDRAATSIGLQTNVSDVTLGPGGPSGTVVKIGNTILQAAAAGSWQDTGTAARGGVHGGTSDTNPTNLGGGAGGYDLSIYGGSGADYNTGDIGIKDRNGGKSTTSGNPTGGTGYGAGGTRLQPGNNGCIVITR